MIKPKMDGSLDRRTLIKRSIALASAGYVVPMVLGSAKPASAQAVSSTCAPEDGDCFIPCQDDGCYCVELNQGGAGVCIIGTCDAASPCTSNADCGDPDLVCVDPNCGCGEEGEGDPFCIPVCGASGFDPDENLARGQSLTGTSWYHQVR